MLNKWAQVSQISNDFIIEMMFIENAIPVLLDRSDNLRFRKYPAPLGYVYLCRSKIGHRYTSQFMPAHRVLNRPEFPEG